jgi:hypothetical protein
MDRFPTIKYFTSASPDGEDYDGGREIDDLKEFAAENLGPTCSLDNAELCGEEELAELKQWVAKPQAELQAIVDAASSAEAEAEAIFEAEVEKLQAKYESLEADKAAAIKAAKVPELSIAKSALGHLKRQEAAAADGDESVAKDEL